jgi:hypothetical protein
MKESNSSLILEEGGIVKFPPFKRGILKRLPCIEAQQKV